jgi:hypothetical protein
VCHLYMFLILVEWSLPNAFSLRAASCLLDRSDEGTVYKFFLILVERSLLKAFFLRVASSLFDRSDECAIYICLKL